MMKFKKLMTFVLVGSLTLAQASLLQKNVKAESSGNSSITENYITNTTKEDMNLENIQNDQMEKILLKVKVAFDITEQYKNFNFSYDEYDRNPTWNFYWNTDDGNSISVQCDKDGNILRYYQSGRNQEYRIPDYLKKELLDQAEAYIKKITPDLASHVKYQGCSYDGMYSNTYSFVFTRIENGFLVPDNALVLNLDAKTGKLVTYFSNWDYNVKFSEKKPGISFSDAMELLSKKIDLSLEYHQSSTDSSRFEGELIYVPKDDYLSVDAYSGKVYDSRVKIVSTEEAMADFGDNASAKSEGKSDSAVLTKEEIAKLEELDGLLSKQEAVNALKSIKGLWIDSKATKQVLNLSQRSLDPSRPEKKSYVWEINLSDPSEPDYMSGSYYQAYITAYIDAKTGEVISFYASTKSYFDENVKYKLKFSEDEGKKIAEDYLKENYKELYNKTEYTGMDDGYIIVYGDAPEYGGRTYTFTRIKNNVSFPSNAFTVSVDLTTGKIYRFDYNWYDNMVFESTDGMITKTDATNKFLGFDGFDLYYEIYYEQKGETEVPASRLVYSIEKIYPQYIDAKTGKQCNYDGTPYEKKQEYSYTDIGNSSNKREIQLLADMGIGFNSNTFRPEQQITIKELNQLLSGIEMFGFSESSLKGSGTITREAAAKYMISALKLDYLADLDMYKADYKDCDQISGNRFGYVVLAENLGLINCTEDNMFRPKDNLTRGEAAQLLIKMCSYYRF